MAKERNVENRNRFRVCIGKKATAEKTFSTLPIQLHLSVENNYMTAACLKKKQTKKANDQFEKVEPTILQCLS